MIEVFVARFPEFPFSFFLYISILDMSRESYRNPISLSIVLNVVTMHTIEM